jgi:hypothetical protein
MFFFFCVLYTTLGDTVCQWFAEGLLFFQCTLYNIMWYCLSMTCGRSLAFFSVLYTALCDKVCQWFAEGLLFFQCTLYNIMWYCLSMTCGRSLVFFSVIYTALYDKVCQWFAAGLWFSQCTLYNIMWYCLSMTSGRSLVFSVYSVQHYVILFVNDLRQVSCFFSVLFTTLCDTVCQWLAEGLLFFQCTLYSIMWYCLSMTCGRSLFFSVYSVQHYVIQFVNYIRQVFVFFCVLNAPSCDKVCQWLAARWFFPPGFLCFYVNTNDLTARCEWGIVECDQKDSLV